jgi:hypothetical protein
MGARDVGAMPPEERPHRTRQRTNATPGRGAPANPGYSNSLNTCRSRASGNPTTFE